MYLTLYLHVFSLYTYNNLHSFKNYCLLCGDEADEEAEKKSLHRRQKMYNVATLSFKESVLTVAQDRFDDVSKAVTARINFEYDVVAADVKYHDNCDKSFLGPNTGGRVGRSQDEAANSAMQEIYKFIESSDDWQFTLDDLKNVSKIVALDVRTIKVRLKVKYGSRIIITVKLGKLTFICFVDNYQDNVQKG